MLYEWKHRAVQLLAHLAPLLCPDLQLLLLFNVPHMFNEMTSTDAPAGVQRLDGGVVQEFALSPQ